MHPHFWNWDSSVSVVLLKKYWRETSLIGDLSSRSVGAPPSENRCPLDGKKTVDPLDQ
jgi:hypothetical protein